MAEKAAISPDFTVETDSGRLSNRQSRPFSVPL